LREGGVNQLCFGSAARVFSEFEYANCSGKHVSGANNRLNLEAISAAALICFTFAHISSKMRAPGEKFANLFSTKLRHYNKREFGDYDQV